jgi:ubiquinone/menaquinone biosynthesis C-methylase UbiE
MSFTLVFNGSVPANYEKYSGASVFEPYALDIIERIKNDEIKNVLEIACGTGRVTSHLSKLIPEGEVLYATDISADMIAIAKTIVTDNKVKWQLADAHHLPFDNSAFDHVVCQFGVMFFQDKPKAFAEVCRVLQPGGKFIFNSWDAIEHNSRSALIKRVLEDFFDNVPDSLTKAVHSFADKNQIRALLKEAGFKDSTIITVQKLSAYHSVDDIIGAVTTGSLITTFLSEKTLQQQENFKQVLKNELVAAYGEKNIKTPMQALVCEALK